MAQFTLTIPSLASQAQATDLENALVGVSGIEASHVDLDQRALVVTYDPTLFDPSTLRRLVAGVGYPVDDNG